MEDCNWKQVYVQLMNFVSNCMAILHSDSHLQMEQIMQWMRDWISDIFNIPQNWLLMDCIVKGRLSERKLLNSWSQKLKGSIQLTILRPSHMRTIYLGICILQKLTHHTSCTGTYGIWHALNISAKLHLNDRWTKKLHTHKM